MVFIHNHRPVLQDLESYQKVLGKMSFTGPEINSVQESKWVFADTDQLKWDVHDLQDRCHVQSSSLNSQRRFSCTVCKVVYGAGRQRCLYTKLVWARWLVAGREVKRTFLIVAKRAHSVGNVV